MAYEINRSIRMAQYHHSNAEMVHTLAHIAPRSRALYVLVEFEVFGRIHGKWQRIHLFLKNFTNQTKDQNLTNDIS